VNEIKLNLENLNESERKQLMKLVDKANKKPMIERRNKGKAFYNVGDFFNVRVGPDGDSFSDKVYKVGNYFTDENLCQQVADYLKRNFMFMRKAIEFARGYKYTAGNFNYYIWFEVSENKYSIATARDSLDPLIIYMTQSQARLFVDWCNENREELAHG